MPPESFCPTFGGTIIFVSPLTFVEYVQTAMSATILFFLFIPQVCHGLFDLTCHFHEVYVLTILCTSWPLVDGMSEFYSHEVNETGVIVYFVANRKNNRKYNIEYGRTLRCSFHRKSDDVFFTKAGIMNAICIIFTIIKRFL